MTEKMEHTPDEWLPAPWSGETHPSLNRTTIRDADGSHIISGMNNDKAARIIAAINSRAADKALMEEMAGALEECALDLESEIEHHYRDIKDHPAMTYKYDRDIAPAKRAFAILAKYRARAQEMG